MFRKATILLLVLLPFLLLKCAGIEKPKVTPQEVAQYNLKFKEAEEALRRYNLVSMRRAFDMLSELLSFPAFKRKTGELFLQTAVVLALRERELGIIDSDVLSRARTVIAQNPGLEGFQKYLDIVERIPAETKGITGARAESDEDFDEYLDWVKNNVESLNTHLKKRSLSSDLFAYLYIAFHGAFSYKFEEPEDTSVYAKRFPDSPLVRFKLAIYPNLDPEALDAIIASDPEFYEVEVFRGNLELQAGRVLSAEKRYLNAYRHIPLSTITVISLANVYFHMEEFDRCLEFNDRALALSPNYRDAILGKAMCLGYLGRHAEALTELQRMLDLGKYYIGESYYWMAWNFKELNRIAEAGTSVEMAKNYLIGHYEVMSLSGIVAYLQGRLEDAESDLIEALKLNSGDCEAAFYLGKVYGDRQDWPASGEFFERAAGCNHQTEAAIQARIKEIEESPMSAARKAKHVNTKKSQLLQTRRTKATAYYNAAAGFYNAKRLDKALAMAEQAAAYPTTREKAQELIATIKQDPE